MTSVANIGVQGRRQRLISGLLLMAASLVAAWILMRADLPRFWRALLFFPLWASALGLFQARDRT